MVDVLPVGALVLVAAAPATQIPASTCKPPAWAWCIRRVDDSHNVTNMHAW